MPPNTCPFGTMTGTVGLYSSPVQCFWMGFGFFSPSPLPPPFFLGGWRDIYDEEGVLFGFVVVVGPVNVCIVIWQFSLRGASGMLIVHSVACGFVAQLIEISNQPDLMLDGKGHWLQTSGECIRISGSSSFPKAVCTLARPQEPVTCAQTPKPPMSSRHSCVCRTVFPLAHPLCGCRKPPSLTGGFRLDANVTLLISNADALARCTREPGELLPVDECLLL